MASSYSVWTTKRELQWQNTILPHTQNGRVYWFTRRRTDGFYSSGRESQLPASRARYRSRQQNCIHRTPLDHTDFPHAIRTSECILNFLTHSGKYFITSQTATRLDEFWLHPHFCWDAKEHMEHGCTELSLSHIVSSSGTWRMQFIQIRKSINCDMWYASVNWSSLLTPLTQYAT